MNVRMPGKGICELVEAFTKDTSLHGARHACRWKAHLYQKIIWMIIVIISVVGCVTLIGKSVSHYLEYKTVSKYSTLFEEQLEFPGITICNINSVSKSKAEEFYQDLNLTSNFDIYDAVAQYMAGTLIDLPEELKHINVAEMLLRTSQPLDQLVKLCGLPNTSYLKLSKNCGSIFKEYFSNFGYCHTLISRDSQFKKPLVSSEVGMVNSFKLLCDIEKHEYYTPVTFGYGMFVEVHDPQIYPNIGSSGLMISPGTESYILIKKDIIKRLGYPYSAVDCIEPLEHPGYSYHKCINDCYLQIMYKGCNCIPYSTEHHSCTLYDYYTCAMVNYKNYKASMLDQCNCLRSCVEVRYDYTITSTEFPNEHIHSLVNMYQLENHTVSYYKENYIHLYINYQNLEVRVVEEVPAVSIEQLLSDIGGLLGLFLGMSVITMCECFQFAVLFMRYLFAKSCQDNPKPVAEYSQTNKDLLTTKNTECIK